MFQQMTDYIHNNSGTLISACLEHLSISLFSLATAVLIGIPAGFLCVRYKRSQKFIISLFQVLRVIPGLAVLMLLIPIMGAGVRPAVTALIILAIPPILMNTVAGLEEVPEFMLETAAGGGMTGHQIWQNVRFPLALPMILTGIKTALIEIIASATLAAKIGAGGLGEIIFTGLGLYRIDLLLIGGIAVAVLSVAAGTLFSMLNRLILRYK